MNIEELKANIEKSRVSVEEAKKILAVRENKLAHARQELANATAVLKPGDVIESDGGPFKAGVIVKIVPPPLGYEGNNYNYFALGIKKDGEVGSRSLGEGRIAAMIARGEIKKIGERPVPALPDDAGVDNTAG